jgi:hypothetical protein
MGLTDRQKEIRAILLEKRGIHLIKLIAAFQTDEKVRSNYRVALDSIGTMVSDSKISPSEALALNFGERIKEPLARDTILVLRAQVKFLEDKLWIQQANSSDWAEALRETQKKGLQRKPANHVRKDGDRVRTRQKGRLPLDEQYDWLAQVHEMPALSRALGMSDFGATRLAQRIRIKITKAKGKKKLASTVVRGGALKMLDHCLGRKRNGLKVAEGIWWYFRYRLPMPACIDRLKAVLKRHGAACG